MSFEQAIHGSGGYLCDDRRGGGTCTIRPLSPRWKSSDSGESDKALVRRFLKGDNRAFELIVRRHQDRVLRICLRILGNQEDAEDAMQETFIKVLKNAGSYKRKAAFSTWLCRIAVNTCYDESKRRKSRERDRCLREDDVLRDTSPKVSDPAEDAVNKELREAIEDALDELPLRDRLVVVLKNEGFSEKEISEILEMVVGTVKSSYHRGRKSLSQKWRLMRVAKEHGTLGTPRTIQKGDVND